MMVATCAVFDSQVNVEEEEEEEEEENQDHTSASGAASLSEDYDFDLFAASSESLLRAERIGVDAGKRLSRLCEHTSTPVNSTSGSRLNTLRSSWVHIDETSTSVNPELVRNGDPARTSGVGMLGQALVLERELLLKRVL